MSDIYGLSKNSRFTVEGNYMTGNDFNITNANQPTKLVRLGLDGMIPSNLYVAGGGGAATPVGLGRVRHRAPVDSCACIVRREIHVRRRIHSWRTKITSRCVWFSLA